MTRTERVMMDVQFNVQWMKDGSVMEWERTVVSDDQRCSTG